MSREPDIEKLAEQARDGHAVKELLASPGWAVIEAKLAEYEEQQTLPMLSTAHEEASKYAFTCGRLRAVKDIRELVKRTVKAGEIAEQTRKEIEA